MKCSTRCGQTVELFHDIFQRFSRQIPPQIVQRHLHAGLPGHFQAHSSRHMGGQQQVGGAPERMVGGQGFGVGDIQRRAPQVAAFQDFHQGVLIQYGAAAGVEEDGIPLHQTQPPGVHQVLGLGGVRQREGDHIHQELN